MQILIETELRFLDFKEYYRSVSSEFIYEIEDKFLSLLNRKKELIKETMNSPEKGSFLNSNAFARKRYHEHLEDLVNFETITNKIFGL